MDLMRLLLRFMVPAAVVAAMLQSGPVAAESEGPSAGVTTPPTQVRYRGIEALLAKFDAQSVATGAIQNR